MTDLDEGRMITLVRAVVEEHGCKIVDIDLENQVLNIDGPNEAQVECALALEKILG